MKREKEISECREAIADESIDHLHIRRKAIATNFSEQLRDGLTDYSVVTVDIWEWDYGELMETLRHDLQKELSTFWYYYSRIKSVGLSFFGGGANAGIEAKPEYSRVSDYLRDVAEDTHNGLVVYVDYHGTESVDGFGWIQKLSVPKDATIVTEEFRECQLDGSEEIEVGRLSQSQTVEGLINRHQDLTTEEAVKIHQIHDGNPVAIDMAEERDSLREPLSGDNLRELWEKVYDQKITGEEQDLLTKSSHLIDLDQRDVASVTDKTRGEANDLLNRLEQKGVVSRKQSGLFTTDLYVKRYTGDQLTGAELSEQHQMSFRTYVEKWVDEYEAQVRELDNSSAGFNQGDGFSLPDFDAGMTNVNLVLAVHHLSQIHDEITQDEFIEELASVDTTASGVFIFGMFTQRFFFEEPTEVIQGLSETLLGVDEELDNELLSSAVGVFFGFDAQELLSILSEGWSGEINTDRLETETASKPQEVVSKIQEDVDLDMYQELPTDVKRAISELITIALTDSRTAREYYTRFGKTAQNYGLEEEAFCDWLDECGNLADILSPETNSEELDDPDPYEEGLKELDNEIRTRIDLEEHLEQNRSHAQRKFQQRVEEVRSRPDEIVEQYVRCGDCLARMENRLFPFLWYAFGHEVFSKIVLGGMHEVLFGEYKEWSGRRKEQEEGLSDDELVVAAEQIESQLGN